MFTLMTQLCCKRQVREAVGQAWDGDPPWQHMFSAGLLPISGVF